MIVRGAAADDLGAIAAIYAEQVATSAVTFDLEDPPAASWEAALRGGWLLVAADDGGTVLGYAKTSRFRERAAYAPTVETSVYVDAAARGRGVGRALYDELLGRLDRSGLHRAVAGMTEPNPASTALHLACGFRRVGTFAEVGRKFDRFWDVTFFERPLGGDAASLDRRP